MPELPEIETIKLQLRKVLIGQHNLKFEIFNFKSNSNDLNQIVGKQVKKIDRIGKMLIIEFENDLKLGFHFKMTGQLVYEPVGQLEIRNSKFEKRIVGGHPTEDFVNNLPSKHTRAIFYFDKGTLYFNDQRKFGWVRINPKFGEKFGPEPFDITAKQFVAIIQKSNNPIKIAIMNQEKISGLGNIYANDALWESGIHPDTSCARLSDKQLKLLLEKIKLVLREGIKYGGATSSDYVNLHGLGGHYQDHFRVYDREGLLCWRCETLIKKIKLGGRGTYFCPKCQK